MSSSESTWCADLPERWTSRRIKYLTTCNDEVLAETTADDHEIQYVDIGSVSGLGVIEKTEVMPFGSAPSRARRVVRSGDVLVSTVRTYLKAIAAVKEAPSNLVASTGFAVIRCDDDAAPGYMSYALRTEGFVGEVIARSVGVSYPAINSSDLIGLSIPAPPLEEQTQIAKFLDYETANIDALIDKQQQLIALLKEKRQAVISHAVTKGLNPDAPMKDSGVEWLGEVPAHWKVSQLKYIAKPGTSITYGIVQAGPHVEDGIPYIKTSDMAGASLPIDGYQRTSREIDESYARSRVFPGDLVISIRASVGKCLSVPDELPVANLTQGTAKISPGQGIERDFLMAFISSSPVQDFLMSQAKGATFKEITLDMLRRVSVLVPPLDEQANIAREVALLTARFDALSEAAESQRLILQERRTALISAAVTGKIDVRGWKAPESDKEVA